MMDIPGDLSKHEVEFWSWLTESHILPEPLEFKPSKKNTSYRLVSTEEIRQLIADAFEKGNSQLADNLLEIASRQQLMSDEIIRKSSRLKTGEYLKLLYIKLLEDTSFSDVIVKILTPYTKKYLEEFRIKWKEQLTQSTERIEHLFSLIESWDKMSPESRSRAVDMGLQVYEGKREIPLDYPYTLDVIKEFIPDYYLSELERKLLFDEGTVYRIKSRVYDEFVKRWRKDLDEYPIGNLSLNVSLDEQDNNRLFFEPTLRLSTLLTYEEQLQLFEKYGERDVVGFINLFNVYSGGEKINYMGSLGDEEVRDIFFWIDINLPGCSVTIEDAINFVIDNQKDSVFIDNLYRDYQVLTGMVKSLSKSVELDTSKFFERDNKQLERNREKTRNKLVPLHHYLRSDTWNEFFKVVTRLAKPDDFITIKKINVYRNRILHYFKVESFVYDLVQTSVTRRSVVSFYVSKDVWRFLPLVLKEQDWYDIAESYLSNQ